MFQLPGTWEWIRILGFLAYFYFTVAIVFGLLRKSAYIKSGKNGLYQIHTAASWFGFLTLIGHMLILLIDQYKPFTWKELLVPFSSADDALFVSLGIFAFYLIFIVMFTSDLLIKVLNKRIWKGIHLLVLPAWLLSLLHGVFIGTDTNNRYVQVFYLGSAAGVLIVMLFRVAVKKQEATTRRHKTGASN